MYHVSYVQQYHLGWTGHQIDNRVLSVCAWTLLLVELQDIGEAVGCFECNKFELNAKQIIIMWMSFCETPDMTTYAYVWCSGVVYKIRYLVFHTDVALCHSRSIRPIGSWSFSNRGASVPQLGFLLAFCYSTLILFSNYLAISNQFSSFRWKRKIKYLKDLYFPDK